MKPENLHVVLVGTTHPGNIGSSARAMKTMGLSTLHLVAPRHFPDPRAEANAGNATDVLRGARLYDTLEAALGEARLVFGLTARRRRLAVPALDVRQAAGEAVEASTEYPVALVFGREHSGLTNDEVDRCHRVVHIPTAAAYPALNLAAAVQVVTYELRMADGPSAVARDAEPPAPAGHLDGFYEHLRRFIEISGYARAEGMSQLMRRLRRLFNRAQPEVNELNILRGLLSAAEDKIRRRG